MRAPLIADETYDSPPRLHSGVLTAVKGVVHVVARNHGIRVRMFCEGVGDDVWFSWNVLEQGWYEFPTCVACALNAQALRARFLELRDRVEWWDRPGNTARWPRKGGPTP